MQEKILWIGPFASDKQIENQNKKGYNRVAAYVSQKSFIEGLRNNNVQVDVYSALRLTNYPQYSDFIIKREIDTFRNDVPVVNVGFLNYKYIDHISRSFSLRIELRKWAKENKDKKVKIIIYSMHSPFMYASKVVKNIIKDSEIYMVVGDLPVFMDPNENKIKKFIKRIDWIIIKYHMRNIDGYFLYSKHMADFLQLNKRWIVLEGIVNYKQSTDKTIESKIDKKICMYAGTLKMHYGIKNLVMAFIDANIKNSELHIYGSGDYEKELRRICEENMKIKFFGFIDNDEILQIEKQASLLINPRPSNEEYTKYSCPSKILEYMASGTPVLTTRLKGIPDEYFDYIYTFDDESVAGMSTTLKDTLSQGTDEMIEKGFRAREFIIKTKNSTIQAKRIIDFMGGRIKIAADNPDIH